MSSIDLVKKQLEELKIQDLKIFNFSNYSPFYDYFIIGTANQRQSNAAINYFKKNSNKMKIKNIEGRNSSWLVIDFYDVVLHLFSIEDREFYNFDDRFIEFVE